MRFTKIRSMKKWSLVLVMLMVLPLLFSGCQSKKTDAGKPTIGENSYPITLRIVSGSENKELEPLLSRFAKENRIGLDMILNII